ncbi:hypothetical protein, partial [Escherichia fergusonii]|uniref:hypothetical protein n=1 Tax=Escherichia fergusonii TaxID=564 RepID=UPI001C5C86CD
CESGPADGSEGSADPELGVFGSQEECRRIIADNATLMMNFELNHIIAFLASIIKIICIIIDKRAGHLFPI